MSRKRPKNKAKVRTTSTPEVVADADTPEGIVEGEVLAEGSGPHEALEAAIDEAAAEIAEQYAVTSEAGSDEVAAMADALEAVADHAHPTLAVVSDDLEAEASAELAAAAEGALGEDAELVEDGEAATLPTSAGSMDPHDLKLLVEALVFAADKPLTVQRLRQLTRIADTKKLEATLLEIQADYEHRGLILSSVSGGWQFRTRPQFSAWVQQLIAGRPVRLSRAQLETLAIVAYRQPITRPEIDDIRGVDSSATLKLLLDRALIRVLGKKEEVGRPMLYGTTKDFLDFFSLADLRELPTLREYSELTDESRQVITNKLGPSDDDGSSGSGSSGSGEGGGTGGEGPLGGGGDETASDGAVATSFDTSDVSDVVRAYADGETMYASSGGEAAPESTDDNSTADESMSALTDDASNDDEAMSASDDSVSNAAETSDAETMSASDDGVSNADETMSAAMDDESNADETMSASDDGVSNADETMSAATDDESNADETMSASDDGVSNADETMSAATDDESNADNTMSASTDDVSNADHTASGSTDVSNDGEAMSAATDDESNDGETMSASTDETFADEDALSRLAARVLASTDAPEAPDAELADGTGAVAAISADESSVEPTDDDARFASGSRAFTAVTDAEAVALAANVAAEIARDDEGAPMVDESATPGMLVATDEIVDDDVPAEPSE